MHSRTPIWDFVLCSTGFEELCPNLRVEKRLTIFSSLLTRRFVFDGAWEESMPKHRLVFFKATPTTTTSPRELAWEGLDLEQIALA